MGAATCATLWAGAAWAQGGPCSDETQEIDRALADRRAGRPLPAYDRLRALWQRCPSARARAQLGLAEQSLRRWPDAYAHLLEALGHTDDPWIVSRRSPLEEAVREIVEHLPRLAPQTNVPGAELRVNGARVGELPLTAPYVLPGGSATIELSAAGYRTLRRVVSVGEGEVFREMLTLELEGPPPAEPRVITPIVAPAPPRPIEGPSVARRVVGWTAVGVGAALVGIGVWQALRWSSLASDTAEATPTSPGALGAWSHYWGEVNGDGRLSPAEVCDRAAGSDSPSAASVRDLCGESRAHGALALGLGLGGAALAAVGAVVLATARPAREGSALQVSPWLGASVRGASLQVAF